MTNISGFYPSWPLKESDLRVSITEVLGQWDPQGVKETPPRSLWGCRAGEDLQKAVTLFWRSNLVVNIQILLLVVLTKSDQLYSKIKAAALSPQSQCSLILYFMGMTNRRIKCADSYIEKAKNETCHLTYFTMRDKKIKNIMSPWHIFLDKLSLALFPLKKYIQLNTNVFDFSFWKFNATMSKFSDFQRRTQILLRQKCWQLDFKNSFGWTQIRSSSYTLSKNGHNSWRIFPPSKRLLWSVDFFVWELASSYREI